MTTKTIDIFIKSYKGDFWLLQLALETIKKNVTGYNNLILLIPEKDKHDFDTRNLPDRTFVHYVQDEGNGWLRQQVFKMNAHKYCYADYIMFSDSDCFFTYPVNLQELIEDEKPEILYTAWEKVGQAIVWKAPTEKFIGEEVTHERMRRNCQIHHREALVEIEKFKPGLEKMIMESGGAFSEFNCISAYCHKFMNDKYKWTNTDDWTFVPETAKQVWSHGNDEQGASEDHLREYIRLLKTIMEAFGVPVPKR